MTASSHPHRSVLIAVSSSQCPCRSQLNRRFVLLSSFQIFGGLGSILMVSHFALWKTFGATTRVDSTLAIGVLLFHIGLFQYACGHKSMNRMVVTIGRAITRDVVAFLITLVILMAAFGLALFLVDVRTATPALDTPALDTHSPGHTEPWTQG